MRCKHCDKLIYWQRRESRSWFAETRDGMLQEHCRSAFYGDHEPRLDNVRRLEQWLDDRQMDPRDARPHWAWAV